MFLPNNINADLYLNKNIYNMLFKLQIDCCIKLSGMPDLTLSFMNPRLFDDVSFHPCVRFKRWEVRTSNNLNFIIALLIKFVFSVRTYTFLYSARWEFSSSLLSHRLTKYCGNSNICKT